MIVDSCKTAVHSSSKLSVKIGGCWFMVMYCLRCRKWKDTMIFTDSGSPFLGTGKVKVSSLPRWLRESHEKFVSDFRRADLR